MDGVGHALGAGKRLFKRPGCFVQRIGQDAEVGQVPSGEQVQRHAVFGHRAVQLDLDGDLVLVRVGPHAAARALHHAVLQLERAQLDGREHRIAGAVERVVATHLGVFLLGRRGCQLERLHRARVHAIEDGVAAEGGAGDRVHSGGFAGGDHALAQLFERRGVQREVVHLACLHHIVRDARQTACPEGARDFRRRVGRLLDTRVSSLNIAASACGIAARLRATCQRHGGGRAQRRNRHPAQKASAAQARPRRRLNRLARLVRPLGFHGAPLASVSCFPPLASGDARPDTHHSEVGERFSR